MAIRDVNALQANAPMVDSAVGIVALAKDALNRSGFGIQLIDKLTNYLHSLASRLDRQSSNPNSLRSEVVDVLALLHPCTFRIFLTHRLANDPQRSRPRQNHLAISAIHATCRGMLN